MGDFLIKKEEAALLREDVLQKKLETHEKQAETLGVWVRLQGRLPPASREEERYNKNQLDLMANYASRTGNPITGTRSNRLKTDFFDKRNLDVAGSNPVKAELAEAHSLHHEERREPRHPQGRHHFLAGTVAAAPISTTSRPGN